MKRVQAAICQTKAKKLASANEISQSKNKITPPEQDIKSSAFKPLLPKQKLKNARSANEDKPVTKDK